MTLVVVQPSGIVLREFLNPIACRAVGVQMHIAGGESRSLVDDGLRLPLEHIAIDVDVDVLLRHRLDVLACNAEQPPGNHGVVRPISGRKQRLALGCEPMR